MTKSVQKRRIVAAVVLLCSLRAEASALGPGDGDADSVLRALAAQDAVVATVGERLSIAAASLCAPPGMAEGMIVQTRQQYGMDYRASAERLLGIGDYPTVTFVIPGGAADRAGLRRGDQISSVDDRSFQPRVDRRAAPSIAATEAATSAIRTALDDGVARLDVLRGDRRLAITLRGQRSCRVRFEVRAGNATDASATRDMVQVSSDLVDPARADQDLAPLMAHELAHVVLHHEDRLKAHRGGVLPGFGRNGRILRDSELSADRLSVYLLALAGYDPADAITFWSVFGRRGDLGILSDRTHPGWKDRVAAVTTEVGRVRGQRARGEPIRPPADLTFRP